MKSEDKEKIKAAVGIIIAIIALIATILIIIHYM
jgi:hypothetical protein